MATTKLSTEATNFRKIGNVDAQKIGLRNRLKKLGRKRTNPLYFAYGSNLNLAQMQMRCPGAIPVATIKLNGYRLVFKTHADIEPAEGESVVGALYDITDADRAALDRYEGFPRYYDIVDFEFAGQPCFFYKMQIENDSMPTVGYVTTIREGFRDWKLPTKRIAAALEYSKERIVAL